MLARRSVRAVVPAGVRGFMSGDVASVIDGGAPHVDKNSESYLKNVEEMNILNIVYILRMLFVRTEDSANTLAHKILVNHVKQKKNVE